VPGIGFTLLNSAIAAVDIDHVRDPKTGLTEPWAEQLIEEAKALGCCVEITPSGAGYRIIGRAAGATLNRRFNLGGNGVAVELYRRCERYITITALEIGRCNELPQIDAFIDALLARYENGGVVTPSDGLIDLNTAGTQQQPLDYEKLIENRAAPGDDRSDLFHSVIGHLYGQGFSEDEILEKLARHPNGIGAKYVGRLGTEVRRSYRKWNRQKQARAGARSAGSAPQLTPPPQPGSTSRPGAQPGAQPTPQPGAQPGAAQQPGPQQQPAWPPIRILAGELPRVVDEAEGALIAAGHELYQRGGLIVRPVLSTFKTAHSYNTLAWCLIPLNAQHLIELMTRSARFYRYNERKKKFMITDAPLKIAETFLAREGQWRTPILTGVVNAPFLRVDGSLTARLRPRKWTIVQV